MNMNPAAAAERFPGGGECLAAMEEGPAAPGSPIAVVASALFAAGVASFAILTPGRDAAGSRAAADPSTSATDAAQAAVPVGGPAAAATPSIPIPARGIASSPQYEDDLVPMRRLVSVVPRLGSAPAPAPERAESAAASSQPGSSAAAPPAPRVEPRDYRGPTLALAAEPRRFIPMAGFGRGTGGVVGGAAAWLTEEALAARRAARAGPLPAPAQGLGLADVQAEMARQWKQMTRQQQEEWTKTWENGAKSFARSQAARQGRRIASMDVLCVGHTDKCVFGELGVTYADGTREVVKFDPLVLDLGGKGFRASRRTTLFDLDGSGSPQTIADLSDGVGLLVFDPDKVGVSGGGPMELFSAATDLAGKGRPDGFDDGFDAFNGLVKKAVREGVVDAKVLAEMRLGAAELVAMEKAYGLKIRVGGFRAPAISLAQAGVVEIGLSADRKTRWNAFDSQGTDLVRRAGADFLRADGTRGEYAEVYLSPRRLLALRK